MQQGLKGKKSLEAVMMCGNQEVGLDKFLQNRQDLERQQEAWHYDRFNSVNKYAQRMEQGAMGRF